MCGMSYISTNFSTSPHSAVARLSLEVVKASKLPPEFLRSRSAAQTKNALSTPPENAITRPPARCCLSSTRKYSNLDSRVVSSQTCGANTAIVALFIQLYRLGYPHDLHTLLYVSPA